MKLEADRESRSPREVTRLSVFRVHDPFVYCSSYIVRAEGQKPEGKPRLTKRVA